MRTNRIKRYWWRASMAQKIALAVVFVWSLVSCVVAGWGIIVGGVVAFLWTALVALLWSGVARLFHRKQAEGEKL